MKHHLILALVFFAFFKFSTAQVEVVLNSNQLPEFGYSISSNMVTINKGDSVHLGFGISIFGGEGEYVYSWSPTTDLDNPSLLQPVATPSDTMIYTLTVIDENGCLFEFPYMVAVDLGTDAKEIESLDEAGMILYPNPNEGAFTVLLNGLPEGTKTVDVVILDMAGRTVYNQQYASPTSDFQQTLNLDLRSGHYLLQCKLNDNVIWKQFIIN